MLGLLTALCYCCIALIGALTGVAFLQGIKGD